MEVRKSQLCFLTESGANPLRKTPMAQEKAGKNQAKSQNPVFDEVTYLSFLRFFFFLRKVHLDTEPSRECSRRSYSIYTQYNGDSVCLRWNLPDRSASYANILLRGGCCRIKRRVAGNADPVVVPLSGGQQTHQIYRRHWRIVSSISRRKLRSCERKSPQ
jgi:hypothetical protein